MYYFIQYTMYALLAGGSFWALSRYEPPSVKRKRVFQEKELARQALQESTNSSQTPNK